MIISLDFQMSNDGETNHHLKLCLMLVNHYSKFRNDHCIHNFNIYICPITSALPGLHQTEGWEKGGTPIGYGGQHHTLKSDKEG